MTNPLHFAILESKLGDFYDEYACRFGESPTLPGVAVKFSSPGLDMHFDLTVPVSFVPAPGGVGIPGSAA